MPIVMHPYKVVTAPASSLTVVTVNEAKAWMKLDLSRDFQDDIVLMQIKAAQRAFEAYTKLTLFTTTFLTTRGSFCQDLELRRGPVQAVSRFQYKLNDVLTDVDPTSFYLHINDPKGFGCILLKDGQIWPATYDDTEDAIEVEFTAGLADDPDGIPDDIKDAILYTVADNFFDRGDCGDPRGQVMGLSMRSLPIADTYRIFDIGGVL